MNQTGPFLFVLFSAIVLRSRLRVPSATLAWILTFALLPHLGPLVYLVFGVSRFRRHRRLQRRFPKKTRERPWKEHLRPQEPRGIARLTAHGTGFPHSDGNRIQALDDPLSITGSLAEAIARAQDHVHLEYYTLQPDETGTKIRDLLIQKANEGRECRLLVDHVGSFSLGNRFLRPLREAGVEFAWFSPLSLHRLPGFHLRNHRKLAVIDGKLAFLGSQNIGNEYLGFSLKRRVSWRDTQLLIEGPAVQQLQTLFSEDWLLATGKPLREARYFPTTLPCGDASLQILPTGPDEDALLLETTVSSLFFEAKERITVMSPYLVPTAPLLVATEAAARRGVQVEYLIPHHSDHLWVDLAARSWFRDLLQAGAEIRLQKETFLHAKVITVDRKIALLGSANMDERSFHLNFELGALIFHPETINLLVQGFDRCRKSATSISLHDLENQSLLMQIRDGFFRAISPLF